MDFILRIILISALLGLAACNGGGGSQSSGSANNGGGGGNSYANEPAFETDQATLDAALTCTEFTHPDKPPVLLVHGTFVYGREQHSWSYTPVLTEMGFDVCEVSYPDRGFGDQQISAEYVANALRRVYAASGRKVAMIGHSQGASMPRWALKFWPSARDAVEDFVLHAAPAHGLDVFGGPLADVFPSTTGMPAGFYQFDGESRFTRIVNTGDETPGDVDYTSIYTLYDELVQPVEPVPTAALDWGMDNPKVSNILLQDICPGLLAEHATIGITDMATFLLTLDAILNPGPADIERAGGAAELCSPVSPLPGVTLPPDFLLHMLEQLPLTLQNGMHEFHTTNEEPPTKPYAQGIIE